MLRLNCGSGQRPFAKPWLNVDSQAKWKPDVLANIADLTFEFEDESCDMIVLHHVLEHFGCGEGRAVITEAHRLLVKGGSLLVFVPDLRVLAQKWLMGKLSTETYTIALYGAYMGDEADRHKWGFTTGTLCAELSQMPWAEVRSFDWRAIAGADIARDDWIIGMECVK